jgi:hypothetical protein
MVTVVCTQLSVGVWVCCYLGMQLQCCAPVVAAPSDATRALGLQAIVMRSTGVCVVRVNAGLKRLLL